MNISSAVVHARPDLTAQAAEGLILLPGVEVHAVSDDGQIVVTMECATDAEAIETFAALQRVEGVLSASLTYTQTENDPDKEICHETDQA